MILKAREYPRPWRWRFALIPVWFGDDQWLWLEFYQHRATGPLSGERRTKDGKTEAYSIYV